jgi:hypothetical protein
MSPFPKRPVTYGLFLLFAALIGLLTAGQTRQLFQQSYPSDLHLEASQSPAVQLQFTMTVTEMQIDPHDDHTDVQVQVNHPSLRVLELQFPLTDVAAVERAIAQELGVSPAFLQPLHTTDYP